MNLMQTVPEVAMIFAEFMMRLISAGNKTSAKWSNLFPSVCDRYLEGRKQNYWLQGNNVDLKK